jgi:hypothetical protein
MERSSQIQINLFGIKKYQLKITNSDKRKIIFAKIPLIEN